jgi:hypothetical protein
MHLTNGALFLISAPVGEWLASRPARFNPGTKCIIGFVSPRAGLEAEKMLSPNAHHSTVQARNQSL